MIAQSAYRQPIAPVGSRVRVRLATQFLRDEGTYGVLVAHPNANLTVRRESIIGPLDRHGLLLCELDVVLMSHDGRVGYIVRIGKQDVRVHRQHITEVLA
jgi:hypothetical protein